MKKIFLIACVLLSLLLFSVTGVAKVTDKVLNEVSVHDPSIIKDVDGKYYVFGSHITTCVSDDLTKWDYVARGYKTHGNVHFGDLSDTLAGSFKWAGENDSDCLGGFAVWAPDVFYNEDYIWEDNTKGAYMMYYSTSSTFKRSCIGLAVAKEIEGPYTYVDTIIYSGFTKVSAKDENSTHNKKYTYTNIDELIEKGKMPGYKDDWGIDDYNSYSYPNAIDPCVYETADGKLYLAYGSWSGGIFSLPLSKITGRPIYPGFDSETEDGRMVDRYFGTHIAGGKGWSGEGPFVWYDEETKYYYLQTSYEWLGSDGGYHIRMFRSETPVGPFTDLLGNSSVYGDIHHEHGVKMFGNYAFENTPRAYTAGGHCSSLVDDDGERYVFYHTRFKNTEHFVLRVHRMFMNKEGWPVIAPFRYMGDCDEKITEEEIIGTYEYINHSNRIGEGTKVNTSCTIMLLNDGVITGAAEGTWERDDKYLTFKINKKTYSGVILKDFDENGESCVTFSLVGGDNEAIWGKKHPFEITEVKEGKVKIGFENEEGFSLVKKVNNSNPKADNGLKGIYEDGYVGKAIRLDGSMGMEIENIDLSESFTLSFWMKPEKIATFTPVIAITEDFNGGKWTSLTTFSNGNDVMIWSHHGEKGQWLEGKAATGYKMGSWQLVTIVFNRDIYGKENEFIDCKVYINGLCVASGNVTKDSITKESRLYFGVNPWDKPFEGLIDEIEFFDYAFSHNEAIKHYNSYLKMW